jgi:hypothetical protein
METAKYRKQEHSTKLTIIGIFLTIFFSVASRMKKDQKDINKIKLKPFDLILLGFSTFRLGRLVSFDTVFEPIRYPFTETVDMENGAGKVVEPKGEGMKRAIGEMISCPICSGTWIAAGLVYGLQLFPNLTRLFLWVNSSIGLAEFTNSLSEYLTWTAADRRKSAGSNDAPGL